MWTLRKSFQRQHSTFCCHTRQRAIARATDGLTEKKEKDCALRLCFAVLSLLCRLLESPLVLCVVVDVVDVVAAVALFGRFRRIFSTWPRVQDPARLAPLLTCCKIRLKSVVKSTNDMAICWDFAVFWSRYVDQCAFLVRFADSWEGARYASSTSFFERTFVDILSIISTALVFFIIYYSLPLSFLAGYKLFK